MSLAPPNSSKLETKTLTRGLLLLMLIYQFPQSEKALQISRVPALGIPEGPQLMLVGTVPHSLPSCLDFPTQPLPARPHLCTAHPAESLSQSNPLVSRLICFGVCFRLNYNTHKLIGGIYKSQTEMESRVGVRVLW